MIHSEQTSTHLRQEDGYSLPELLMAAVLLLGLLAVGGMMLGVVVRTQPRVAERSAQIQQGRTMIEQLTRELREGSEVETPFLSSTLTFNTFVRKQACGDSTPLTSPSTPARECEVQYACTAGSCRRTEKEPDSATTPSSTLMVEGLNSSEVFSYSPASAPRHVTVTLEYPAQAGGESITLSDGAALRNIAGQ